MFFEQLQRERLVALRQRAVAHHVRKHDGGKLAGFGVAAHFSRPTFLSSSVKRGSVRSESKSGFVDIDSNESDRPSYAVLSHSKARSRSPKAVWSKAMRTGDTYM